MTVAPVRLPESLQALIDARLDTVDRMLLGRVPRPDRMAIRSAFSSWRRSETPSRNSISRSTAVPAARPDWPHIYTSNWTSPQDHSPVRLVSTGRSHGSGADARRRCARGLGDAGVPVRGRAHRPPPQSRKDAGRIR